MTSSETLIEQIKEFEGLRLCSYKCSAGTWTIGYGHTSGVRQNQSITREQAEQLLREDLQPREAYVNGLGLELTQNQFDALVDFVFNVGTGAFDKSTLLKRIKAGAPEEQIIYQFGRWVYAGGKVLDGLITRRCWEAWWWHEDLDCEFGDILEIFKEKKYQ